MVCWRGVARQIWSCFRAGEGNLLQRHPRRSRSGTTTGTGASVVPRHERTGSPRCGAIIRRIRSCGTRMETGWYANQEAFERHRLRRGRRTRSTDVGRTATARSCGATIQTASLAATARTNSAWIETTTAGPVSDESSGEDEIEAGWRAADAGPVSRRG